MRFQKDDTVAALIERHVIDNKIRPIATTLSITATSVLVQSTLEQCKMT